MTPSFLLPQSAFWWFVTRFGESQILLPFALLMLAWVAVRARRPALAVTWLACLGVGVALTTASKIAFIGFGVGYAPANYTGISGHAMCAAAVYPMLAMAATADASVRRRRILVVGAYVFAAFLAVSRVMVYAHSWSEVALGFALGAAVSVLAMLLVHMPHARIPTWSPVLIAVAVLGLVLFAPKSRTHDLVTRVALKLSGRPAPYTRMEMLRGHARDRARPPHDAAGGGPGAPAPAGSRASPDLRPAAAPQPVTFAPAGGDDRYRRASWTQ